MCCSLWGASNGLNLNLCAGFGEVRALTWCLVDSCGVDMTFDSLESLTVNQLQHFLHNLAPAPVQHQQLFDVSRWRLFRCTFDTERGLFMLLHKHESLNGSFCWHYNEPIHMLSHPASSAMKQQGGPANCCHPSSCCNSQSCYCWPCPWRAAWSRNVRLSAGVHLRSMARTSASMRMPSPPHTSMWGRSLRPLPPTFLTGLKPK